MLAKICMLTERAKSTLRKTATKPLARFLRLPASTTPIYRHDSSDIFIVGYPKSGNTWTRFLVAGAIFGIDIELAPSSVVYSLVPDVHHSHFYQRFCTPTFFKSHRLPQADYRRVIYLMRDGRDVMVSYFHHLSAMGRGGLDIVDFIRDFKPRWGRWHEHVEAWTRNPYGAQMLIVTYEELVRSTLSQLKRICDFAGVERTDDRLQRVVESTSFEALRHHEEVDPNFRESRSWPAEARFFRRGQVGSFRDELTQEAQGEFLKQARSMLERFGYLT